MVRLFIAALTFAIALPARAELIDLDPEALGRMVAQGVPLIDVRTEREWRQTGVVQGSHLLTFFDERGRYDAGAWTRALSQIVGPNDPVILICRSGNRTRQIGTFLDREMGYRRVYHLKGGIKRWMKAGNQTVPPSTR